MTKAEEQGLGWGSALAPPGSVEHAKRWRLDMQAAVDDMDRCPDFIEALKTTGDKWRVWTLLKRKDGRTFSTWPEFCEEERPFGLGTPADRIDSVLEFKLGHNAYQRLTVAPDRRAFNGANQYTGPREESPHDEGNAHASVERLRAINRAPEAIRELYDAGLVGQREAAKLGPKNPTPDQAAEAVRVADSAVAEARRHPVPKTETEKRRVQRKVNEVVRAAVGKQSTKGEQEHPDPAPPAQLYSNQNVADTAKVIITTGRIARGGFQEADWQTLLKQWDEMIAVREYGTKEN